MDAGLQLYIREAGRVLTLSARAEQALVRRIRRGDLTARDELVRSHLHLVPRIARAYEDKGLSLSELIEQGNLGLIRAAEKFEDSSEVRFSSYACRWIRRAVRRSLVAAKAR